MRTTIKTLEMLVTMINKMTKSPLTPYTRNGQNFKSNPGCYTLSQQYGGVGLERICNEGGGVHVIFHTTTKRELEAQLRAFISGLAVERCSEVA